MEHFLEYEFSIYTQYKDLQKRKDDEKNEQVDIIRKKLPQVCVERIIGFYEDLEEIRKKEREDSFFVKNYGKCLSLATDFLIKSGLTLCLAIDDTLSSS